MKHSRSLLLSIAAMMLLIVDTSAQVASASATSPIERVWSFNGGEVAIQPQPGGTFVGTVVTATKFAQCSHPVGEQMWTNMTLQLDGSYFGLHQWYFETAECVRNPKLGPTAWRVMEAANGAHYLLACFSAPGGTQPTIAASGATANVTYGCFKSAEIAPVPVEAAPTSSAGVQTFTRSVSLPSNRKCFSGRVLEIHLKDPKYDPLKEVLVTIGRHRVRVVRRRGKVFPATVHLKGLPFGTFTVKIREITVLGHNIVGSRTYRSCAKKPIKLKPKLPSKARKHG